jgi:hypothetical protein
VAAATQEHGPHRLPQGDDAQPLEPAGRLVDEPPTYAYPRIGALLIRGRLGTGLPRLNRKLPYRLMAQNGLLLQRHVKRPPERVRVAQIIAIRPNL